MFRIQNFTFKSCIVLLIIYCCCACSPTYYIPTSHIVPELEKEKDLIASGSYYFASSPELIEGFTDTNGGEVNVAYSPKNKFGVLAGYSNVSTLEGSKLNMFKLGAGYYNRINPEFSYKTYFITEFGKLLWLESADSDTVNLSTNLNTMTLQPSISLNKRIIDLSFSVNFKRLSYDRIESFDDNFEAASYLRNNSLQYLLEPALSLKSGSDKLKFKFQYGRSFNLTNPDFRQHRSYITLGVVARLNLEK